MGAGTSRRDFIMRTSTLAALCSHRIDGIAQQRLPQRTIPVTGEGLPIVGLGSTKAVSEIATEGAEPLAAVIRILLDFGGKVIDTAPRSDEIDAEFGKILSLPDLQDQLFVAAKISTRGEDAGIEQMLHTQQHFNRRTLDLVQVESLVDLDTHWPNLRAWKDSLEARYIGVTVSSYGRFEQLESFMQTETPDFVHLNYSVVETRAEQRLLPLAEDLGIAVIVNRPFMNGSYFRSTNDIELPAWAAEFDCTSWAQFSLKYILAHPAVTCVLTETTNPDHMAENIHTAFGRFPNDATKRRMRTFIEDN